MCNRQQRARGAREYSGAVLITYRRTVGPFAALALAMVALAAMTLTAAAAVTLLVVVVGIAAIVVCARAVLPGSWHRRSVPVAPRRRMR